MYRLWPRLNGQAASIGAEGVAVLAVVERHGGLLSTILRRWPPCVLCLAVLGRGQVPFTCGLQSMAIFRRRLKSFSIFPVPSTTAVRGSSATPTGRFVS